MHGCAQPFHIPTRGKGNSFFRAIKSIRQVRLDRRGRRCIHTAHGIPNFPPVLTAPQPNEVLLLYIAATDHVISMLLVVERKETGHVYKVQ